MSSNCKCNSLYCGLEVLSSSTLLKLAQPDLYSHIIWGQEVLWHSNLTYVRAFWDGELKTPSLPQKSMNDIERTKLVQNQYNHVNCSNYSNRPFDKIWLRLEMTIWEKKAGTKVRKIVSKKAIWALLSITYIQITNRY